MRKLNLRTSVRKKVEHPRSRKWPALQKKHIAEEPTCAACGTSKRLTVHHIRPVHLWPELEEKDSSEQLITLCETPSHNCHFMFGHLLDWKSYNLNVRDAAAAYLGLLKTRPYERAPE
jgi:5-methylcytosine-specific restriction protein A